MSRPARIPVAVPSAPVRVNAPLALMIRLEEVMAFQHAVRDPARSEEAHDLRIAVKRLRYTLEIYAGAVEGSDGFLKDLKALQTALGNLHDADVLIELLEAHFRSGTEPWELALLENAKEQRDRHFEAFMNTWDALLADGLPNRFWRAALEASGPASPCESGNLSELPPTRTRRIHKAVAMLRLAPWAALHASPEGVSQIRAAMARVRDTAVAPGPDGDGWKKAVRRYGRTLAAIGAAKCD